MAIRYKNVYTLPPLAEDHPERRPTCFRQTFTSSLLRRGIGQRGIRCISVLRLAILQKQRVESLCVHVFGAVQFCVLWGFLRLMV